MKKYLTLPVCTLSLLWSFTLTGQGNIEALLAAGVEDAQHFTDNYLESGTDALMYGINNGWYNTGNVKPLLGFEISVIGNIGLIKDSKRSFLMDASEYNNVRFVNDPQVQSVATVLGENDPSVLVEVTYDDPVFGEQTVELELPNGLKAEGVNFLPTAFLQGSLGLSFGTEFKLRFVPKVNAEDADINMYGFGLQHDFTHWLPVDNLLPVSISGLVGYTRLNGRYDFTEASGIEGENQRMENNTNTWLFQLIASTKLPVINFYGGLGYLSGKSKSDVLGTYIVTNEFGMRSETITDPFSVSSNVSGVRATLGTRLKLGFFRLHADYSFAEYNSLSMGVNFGFR